MKKNTLENVTVVIRYAGEATLQSLKNQVSQEVDKKNIFVIEEKPFSKAVEKTFSIGISNDKKWTLALDADLLLLPNAVEKLLHSGSKFSDKLYVYQANILDWFKEGLKYGGPHLYKTCNLKEALSFVEQNENNLRPESAIYRSMTAIGYEVVVEDKIFAIHDFYQSLKDIYRKAFFHGLKHKGYVSMLPVWMKKSVNNTDFEIAVKGYIEGFYDDTGSYPSVNDLNKKFKESFALKTPDINNIESEDVLKVLVNADISINDKYEISKKSKLRNSLKFLQKFQKKVDFRLFNRY